MTGSFVHGLSFIVIELERERLIRMRKISLSIFLRLFFINYAPCTCFLRNWSRGVERDPERYEKTNDYESYFVQEYIGKGMRQPKQRRGKGLLQEEGDDAMGLHRSSRNSFQMATPFGTISLKRNSSRFRRLKGPQRKNASGFLSRRGKSRPRFSASSI